MAETHIFEYLTDMVPAKKVYAVMFRHGETLRFAPKTFQTNATPVTGDDLESFFLSLESVNEG